MKKEVKKTPVFRSLSLLDLNGDFVRAKYGSTVPHQAKPSFILPRFGVLVKTMEAATRDPASSNLLMRSTGVFEKHGTAIPKFPELVKTVILQTQRKSALYNNSEVYVITFYGSLFGTKLQFGFLLPLNQIDVDTGDKKSRND